MTSDEMPREPSEEAIEAAQRAWFAGATPRTFSRERLLGALRAAYAADRGAMPSDERRALWRIISNWSFHDDGCPAGDSEDEECDCGYHDAMGDAHRFHPSATERTT